MHAAQTCNLARLLSDTARLWPDRTALIQGEQRWTWAQIDVRVDALVAALRSLGLKKGDRILLQSRNNLAMFESGWAAFRMGCVWVPTNFRLAPSEVAYLAASSGAATVLLPSEKMDPALVWLLIERHRVSNLFTVPTIVKMLVEHPAVDQRDHSSLRFMVYAGAPMYRADQRLALQKLGLVLVQYFGLGEVTGCITVLPARMHSADDADPNAHIGACGLPRTGMEVAVLDDQMKPLAVGQVGEICVRGPAVFAGYHDNPEASAKALRGGWFHTGDLGTVDARGLLYITGRESDMYISGGSNVYPREAEELLLSHPGVAEVAVLGVPDRQWGEVGVAVVVRRGGADAVSADALMAFLDGRLARYRWPRQIFFWDSLPKSGYGKITKNEVRALLFVRGDVQRVSAD